MATIDVLLPVKDGIDYLAESLDSICNQTYKDWRLLILDHGSTDGSKELAESYHQRDSRVEVHSFPDAVGLAGLLNKGLEICDCDYVMRHDADDIAMPERMAVTLTAFEKNPEIAVIGGQAIIIDGEGKTTGALIMPIGRDRVTAASFFKNPIAHPTAMIRFSDIKEMGIRYGVDFLNVLPKEKQIIVNTLAEDYFLFGQLGIIGKCLNIPDNLIKYRRHGSNVSILKFRDQMDVSLNISRNLARSFCVIHKLQYFDPAPFCNHGGILFNVDNKNDFSQDFIQLETALKSSIGESTELTRELAYRNVLSTRNEFKLLWRYFRFQSRYSPDPEEWYAVKSWFVRHLPGRHKISVSSELSS
jgi:glycosyltransferase involved in cell wall biosynthesis